MALTNEQLSAQLYDDAIQDWPGEIDFYRQLVQATLSKSVLEVACGTGRILLRLADDDIQVTGIDMSSAMLEVARAKAVGKSNIALLEGDMKSFDLNQTFQLAIVPGHSFQFMLTPDDQVACLESIKQHLAPNGTLVVHLAHDPIDWLGDLYKDQGGVFAFESEVPHPTNGNRIRISKAWSYDPTTQTNSAVTRQEELDENGAIISRSDSQPTALHSVFRFEMEHLLRRVGFIIEHVYGDFFRQPLTNDSDDMIWVAKLGI